MDTQNRMQREIKFRAWDRLNRKIVTSGLSINIDTTDRVIPVSFTQGDIAYCRDNDVNSVPNVHSDIELMQYTGLKDKNGVEIYEGDIIRLVYIKEPIDHIAKVVYSKSKAAFILVGNDGNPRSALGSMAIEGDKHTAYYSNEVIGNIYEHPELLKG